jgi:hypothetical protein
MLGYPHNMAVGLPRASDPTEENEEDQKPFMMEPCKFTWVTKSTF